MLPGISQYQLHIGACRKGSDSARRAWLMNWYRPSMGTRPFRSPLHETVDRCRRRSLQPDQLTARHV